MEYPFRLEQPSRLSLYLKNISHQVEREVRLSITKDIDEDVNWIQYSVAANGSRTDFELSDVIIQHIPIGELF